MNIACSVGSINVIAPGLFTTVQDLGRPGWAAQGVPSGGAADPLSLRVGNRLVGNVDGDAALEMTVSGGTFAFEVDAAIALSGGAMSAWIESQGAAPRPLQLHVVEVVRAGQQVRCGAVTRGARTYLCVRGGLLVPPVLGSASTHVAGGFGGHGGRALRAGDRLAYVHKNGVAISNLTDRASEYLAGSTSPAVIRAVTGAHADTFSSTSAARFWQSPYIVSSQADRMGIRLTAFDPLTSMNAQMLSEGMPWGAIQVPPEGHPIVLMPDRPTTGGYPVIACVASVDLPALGQLRAGSEVRFECVSLADARRMFLEREAQLDACVPRRAGAWPS
jgi:antagonist of KipI